MNFHGTGFEAAAGGGARPITIKSAAFIFGASGADFFPQGNSGRVKSPHMGEAAFQGKFFYFFVHQRFFAEFIFTDLGTNVSLYQRKSATLAKVSKAGISSFFFVFGIYISENSCSIGGDILDAHFVLS